MVFPLYSCGDSAPSIQHHSQHHGKNTLTFWCCSFWIPWRTIDEENSKQPDGLTFSKAVLFANQFKSGTWRPLLNAVTQPTLVLDTAWFFIMDVETNRSAVSPKPPQLTPELKDFIQRILVPILVDRYLSFPAPASGLPKVGWVWVTELVGSPVFSVALEREVSGIW